VLHKQVLSLLEQLDSAPAASDALTVKIQQVKDERWVSYKKVKMLAFSLEFTANVHLPDYVGLGKGCSEGWGVVKGLG